MIKPDEVRPRGAPSPKLQFEIDALERKCDEEIRRADQLDHWPASIGQMRMTISKTAIEAVAFRYIAAGWRVTVLPDCGSYLEIDRP